MACAQLANGYSDTTAVCQTRHMYTCMQCSAFIDFASTEIWNLPEIKTGVCVCIIIGPGLLLAILGDPYSYRLPSDIFSIIKNQRPPPPPPTHTHVLFSIALWKHYYLFYHEVSWSGLMTRITNLSYSDYGTICVSLILAMRPLTKMGHLG